MTFEFGSKLKNHSTREIEKAISQALSALTGEKLEATIDSLEFTSHSSVAIDLKVGTPIDLSFFTRQAGGEPGA